MTLLSLLMVSSTAARKRRTTAQTLLSKILTHALASLILNLLLMSLPSAMERLLAISEILLVILNSLKEQLMIKSMSAIKDKLWCLSRCLAFSLMLKFLKDKCMVFTIHVLECS